ncbi:MAG: polysaccharide deacetylase [Leptotrichia sp.]|jgi:polysaccharide deacetylase family protein|uniref:polysaccharide deacetylase family protein n=1 Tax=Leptotrichia sp. oral taxon 498 TaxID=712368 RepID=UPI000B8D02BC|nr:polysaccharide deacetylase family protein [Leptotrichia sp. oral taxon 498]ASQ47733.1 polysaccharide deacetylase [Leptotrichia sp. oral taxon 498]RKW34877.1 MAG: polysaccharide deacetylase [Leptotrichia sp.]
MKKGIAIIGIIAACAGFAYSGWHILGTTSKLVKNHSLNSNIKKLEKEKSKKEKVLDELTKKNEELTAKYEQMKKDGKIKIVHLTFDDGPSNNTEKILEILKRNNIKATFFVIGHNQNKYKEIIDAGHAIGLHSYTHDYKYIYANEHNFFEDLYRLRDAVKAKTGKDVRITRFPGGSSNAIASKALKQQIITRMAREGYIYHDWNCDSTDASGNGVPVQKLIKYGICTNHPEIDVLMHDTNVKGTTVQALQTIIDGYRKAGYSFEVITPSSMKIQHVKQPELKDLKK